MCPQTNTGCIKNTFFYCIILCFALQDLYFFSPSTSLHHPFFQSSILRCACLCCSNACVNSSIRPYNLTDNWNKVGDRCWGHTHTRQHTQPHFHTSTRWCIRINSCLEPLNQYNSEAGFSLAVTICVEDKLAVSMLVHRYKKRKAVCKGPYCFFFFIFVFPVVLCVSHTQVILCIQYLGQRKVKCT